MSRYIDAEKLEQRLRVFSDWCRDKRKDGVDFVLNGVLADNPTADVQEVRHGKWELIESDVSKCTVCGCLRNIETQDGWNFCPNCGAKMNS